MILRTLLALALVAGAAPALAQDQNGEPQNGQQQNVAFIPRYDFHLGGAHLSDENPRYNWDANFGGELDVVDYGLGRFTFWANYNVVLGQQLRAFDPNQGNYVLAGSTSARIRGIEVAGVFYHQSRHLADRVKQPAVAWNMMGVRVVDEDTEGRVQWRASGDAWHTVQHALVDYRWQAIGTGRVQVGVKSRTSWFADGNLQVMGVDGSAHRGTQHGYDTDTGVRFDGNAGVIELFVGVERRIDPYPVEFGSATWFKAGFRLVSR